uniref:3'-5' exoribonuclease CSL4 n=1 Tax=Ascaris suum TaxID=6253 RepID=F1LDU9_ASCSU
MESPSLATEASASAMQSKTVFPGDRLFPISERLRAGIGTYELFGHIYASLFGVVHMLPATEGTKQVTTVEVRRNNEIEQRHIVPYIGCIATAKVQNIGPNYAKCGIVCVDASMLAHEFSALLRKEDIRATERDKTEIYLCVQPGDVILARVIGFGETQTTFLLSTAEDELGVVSSKGDAGERMVPSSFTEVKSTLTGRVESRKVAKRSGYTIAAGGITLTIIRWGRATGLFFIESIESMLNRRSRITLERSLR